MHAMLASGRPRDRASVTSNRTVVVVEDDAQMREALHSVLDARGYRTLLYASAEAAIDADVLAEARCVVLDVALPGMSGVELCERLRASPAGAGTPVIMITAHDRRHLREVAEELGVLAYLVKPFSGRRLAFFIDHVLEPSGAH